MRTCQKRIIGGLKIRKLKPYKEDSEWKAVCPDDDCNYIMIAGEIHTKDDHDRTYTFWVDD